MGLEVEFFNTGWNHERVLNRKICKASSSGPSGIKSSRVQIESQENIKMQKRQGSPTK